MFSITADCQHIHADPSMSEGEVLALSTKQASLASVEGKVLVDVKFLKERCECDMMPPGNAWMVIIYYLEYAEV